MKSSEGGRIPPTTAPKGRCRSCPLLCVTAKPITPIHQVTEPRRWSGNWVLHLVSPKEGLLCSNLHWLWPVHNLFGVSYTHTYIHAYKHICVHIYIHMCTRKYIHTCMQTDVYAHTHTHVHAHTHTYTHTHIHTYLYT